MNICSFLPSATEIIYKLGLQDGLRGVTHECDYPPDARNKPVVVRSVKLPTARRDLRPRVVLEVDQQGERLSVLPTMVYGDPPTARVEGERLIYLGGALPNTPPAGG